MQTLTNIKNSIDKAITDASIQKSKTNEKCTNKVLAPAFRYISDYKFENHRLQKMADLCHISSSYFSKLFAKETGENFSVYMMRSKVNWAKELLETTDKSISEIGIDIGFSDSAHFIKTFKKYEGITPARYRNSVIQT